MTRRNVDPMRRLLTLVLLILLPALVSAQTAVVVRGKVSTVNATTTPLANAAVFTGTFEDTRDYPSLTVTTFADQSSASNGLEIQWSNDGVNVDVTDAYTITANVGRSWTKVTRGRYFRLKYTNGSVTQTTFRMGAVLRQSGAPSVESGSVGLTDTELRATPVPVSGTVTATPTGTQAVSGTVTANAGTNLNTSSLALDATLTGGTQKTKIVDTGGTNVASVSAGGAVKVDGSAATQPVSGTVTVTDGSGALNVIVDSGALTATVTDGAGALNTIVDSGSITATQATGTNLHTVVDSGTVTVSDGAGALNVIVDSGSITNTPPSNQSVNLNQIVGTAADVNSGNKSAGTLRKDGTAQLTDADGDHSDLSVDAYGVQYMRLDHPNRIRCTADNIAASLTELTGCGVPGASLSIYITNLIAVSTTTTAGTFQVRYGTGTNCGTGTVAIFPPVSTSRTYGLPASNAATGPFNLPLFTPVKIPANNAVCVIGAATNTTNIIITGFIAP
jgi:hypothetical protein